MKLTNQDKKQIRIWVDNLKSGKYSQTRNILEDDKGFCCLGVGCKLFSPKEPKDDGCMSGGMPSEFAPEWLQSINDDVYLKTRVRLSVLNDDKDYNASFLEIANLVESLYLEVGE